MCFGFKSLGDKERRGEHFKVTGVLKQNNCSLRSHGEREGKIMREERCSRSRRVPSLEILCFYNGARLQTVFVGWPDTEVRVSHLVTNMVLLK